MEALSFDLSSYFEQIALARHKFRNADLETMLGEVWQQIHRIPPDTPGYPRIPQKKSTGYPRIPQVCRINSSSLCLRLSRGSLSVGHKRASKGRRARKHPLWVVCAVHRWTRGFPKRVSFYFGALAYLPVRQNKTYPFSHGRASEFMTRRSARKPQPQGGA